jgi:Fic family protein
MAYDAVQTFLARCDRDAARLRQARPLAPDVLAKIRDHLRVALTYGSNAIEGNTLTLQETAVVLEGQTVGGKPLRDHLEAVDHAAAFDFIWDLAVRHEPLTAHNVRTIHALVTRNTLSQGSGAWRTVGVRITASPHQPPDAIHVPSLMEAWVQQCTQPLRGEHPLVRAARLHADFVSIHPFLDGNGHTARLLTNLDLIRCGYVPALLLPQDRLAYYQALDATRRGSWEPLIQHFALAVHRSFEQFWLPYLGPAPERSRGGPVL